MTTLPMNPIPVPPEAAATRATLKALSVGPPPGVSADDCGTLECLVGRSEEGWPMYAGYWRPDPDQLTALNGGGFIEMVQYTHRLVMHSMTVWAAAPDEPELIETVGCAWVDCQVEGQHSHETESRWVNPGDPTAGEVLVHAGDDGTVEISEAALAQLLTDAGWERAR